MESPAYDVIIIGAGYAGLCAAHHCLQHGLQVKVLEARERIGGRVYTEDLGEQGYVDLGAQWIGPGQDRMYSLAKKYNIQTFRTYETGKSLLYRNNKLSTYAGLIPPLPIAALLDLDRAIKKINKLSQSIDLSSPWKSPKAQFLDSITLESWIRKHIMFQAAKTLFRIGIRTVFACEASDISLLHALFYIKSGKDLDTLLNIDKGAQQNRIEGGAQTILEKIQDGFPSQTVHLSEPVIAVSQTEDLVQVRSTQREYACRKVILSVPPSCARKIDFDPLLPAKRDLLWQKTFMGSVLKCYGIYKAPFWRDSQLNGLGVKDDGYVSVTFDNSLSQPKGGMLMGFVVGDKAREFGTFSPLERKEIVIGEFVQLFGEKAREIVLYRDKNWADDPWSRGCYAGILPTNTWTSVGDVIRQIEGNIHWAGTETAIEWNGYMEGAVRSGERAATEVVKRLKS